MHTPGRPGAGSRWPSGGVTWARIGHQAIDGLGEGVRYRKVGDLGAEE